MGSHWVLFLLYLNVVLSWPEDGRSRPKHVAKSKYNLIVIAASPKWDPIEYYFYCTLKLFLVGLKMAGHGRNMYPNIT